MINQRTNIKKLFLLICSMASMSGKVWADEPSSWYVGGNIGQANSSINNDAITTGLYNGGITTGGGLTVSSITDSGYDTGFKLFGGYQYNRYLSAEVGYVDFGKLGFVAYTNPAGSLTGQFKAHAQFIDGLVNYPVDDNTTLFVRAGITFNQAESDFSDAGSVVLLRTSYSDNSTDYNIGIGGSRKITQSIELRAEAERFHLDDGTSRREAINLISLGVVVHF